MIYISHTLSTLETFCVYKTLFMSGLCIQKLTILVIISVLLYMGIPITDTQMRLFTSSAVH